MAHTTAQTTAGTSIGSVHERRLFGGVLAALEAEQDRWFLWLPVLFGCGIAFYFALPSEPSLRVALAPLLAVGCLAVVWRSGLASLLLTGAIAACAFGLATAKLRSDRVAAPVLAAPTAAVLEGWIELVERRPGGAERLTVRVASIDSLAEAERPLRVRVRVPGGSPALAPGDAIRVRGNLSPPAAPALPGGYDFGRTAWFLSIGAVGYAPMRPAVAELAAPIPFELRWRTPVERLRQDIGQRITASLAGETGAIATALITGERGAISDATNDAFRDSGLLHILSISGLHMTIMAGAVFLSVRFLLSLVPALALNWPIKKWAAGAAALAALGYLMISGSSPPTVRSYIMISIMFLAVLLDRPALALRNVALAALAILVVFPESLIDVGFQMSFAAVTALVAAYELVRERAGSQEADGSRSVLWGVLLFFGGIVLSTVIAGLSVAPFAAYHFHKSQQYAVIANLIAIPICNILVMPAALATLAAMPFGLEAWPLKVMGLGIEAMVWCAYRVAALPGAVGRVPAMPTLALGLMIGGGLWICLWWQRWRWLGALPILAGLLIAPLRTPPDILVGRDGALVAVRDPRGELSAIGDRSAAFELARWLEHDGDGRRIDDVMKARLFRCDDSGCVAPRNGRVVAVSRTAAALAEDCRTAVIIVALLPRPAFCPRTALYVDRAALGALGAHSIRFETDGAFTVRTVTGERGQRPWVRPVQSGYGRRTATGGRVQVAGTIGPECLISPMGRIGQAWEAQARVGQARVGMSRCRGAPVRAPIRRRRRSAIARSPRHWTG